MESIGSDQAPTRRARRSFTKQFKAELVARVETGEQTIAKIALEHDINANLLHKWVTSARQVGPQTQMIPVALSEPPEACRQPPALSFSMT